MNFLVFQALPLSIKADIYAVDALLEPLRKRLFGKRYTFVSLAELVAWTNAWAFKLDRDMDAVIGIPRSGLLVASILAVKLGKPLSTPDMLMQGKLWVSDKIAHPPIRRVLLVDDSVTTGRTLSMVTGLLREFSPKLELTKGSLLVTPRMRSAVDVFYKVIPQPRIFEWNMLHSSKGKVVSDLDGVLCENCPRGVDADEKSYLKWIASAKPLMIPAFELEAVVSNRLEKYRPQTEQWLRNHHVKYRQLLLWDLKSKAERKGRWAENKIAMIVRVKPDIVWESDHDQAEKIFRATGIPTLSIGRMQFFC